MATRRVPVAHHNEILRRAYRRADELEGRLADILVPILERAGEEAAAAFELYATDHLTAAARAYDDIRVSLQDLDRWTPTLSLTAADLGVRSNSTMVCVKPRPAEAEALADVDGEPAENLHVTLVYIGEVDGPLDSIVEALAGVAASHAPLTGTVGGYGQFVVPDGKVGVLLPDVPGLVELRVAVTDALVERGVEYARNHGYTPHITVDSQPEDDEASVMLDRAGQTLSFDDLMIVRGDTEVVPVMLTGSRPLTAAARALVAAGGKPFCLPAEVRTKTDPVRLAVIDTVAKASVEGAGIVYDVSNPYIDKALSQTASQITEISRTTQLDVMKVIRASYDEGLSIPDTAKSITAYMREAAPVRARLIARTELAGAVNGGSLAATRIVSDATGDAYYKQWLTAEGAKYPRHELYDGLDGQTRNLDDYFDVGGFSLQHPGDPEGPPEEVCACRCTLAYTEDASELTAGALVDDVYLRCPSFEDTYAEVIYHALQARRLVVEPSSSEEWWAFTAAAGPAGWTAPAADEVLNVSCDAGLVQEAAPATVESKAAGYDTSLLPDYAKHPVSSLTAVEAGKEAKRLKVLEHSLKYRASKQTGAKADALVKRAEATRARVDELKAHAAGKPPPPAPVAVEHVPEELPVFTPEPVVAEVPSLLKESSGLVEWATRLNKRPGTAKRIDQILRDAAATGSQDRVFVARNKLGRLVGAAAQEPADPALLHVKSFAGIDEKAERTLLQQLAMRAGEQGQDILVEVTGRGPESKLLEKAGFQRFKAGAYLLHNDDPMMHAIAEGTWKPGAKAAVPTGPVEHAMFSVPDLTDGEQVAARAKADWQKSYDVLSHGFPQGNRYDVLSSSANRQKAKRDLAKAISSRLAKDQRWIDYIDRVVYGGRSRLGSLKVGDQFQTPYGTFEIATPAEETPEGQMIQAKIVESPSGDWEVGETTWFQSGFDGWVPLSGEVPKGAPKFVMPSHGSGSTSTSKVAGLIDKWASSSFDDDAWMIALQKTAVSEFGVDDESMGIRGGFGLETDAQSDLIIQDQGDALAAFLQAMYDNTQATLREAGFSDTVTLYRGQRLGTASELKSGFDRATVRFQPMSSFSSNIGTAVQFSSPSNGLVVGAQVPTSRIIGMARTGFGCLNEFEFVVLGAPKGTIDEAVAYVAREGQSKISDILNEDAFWTKASQPHALPVQTEKVKLGSLKVGDDYQYNGEKWQVEKVHPDGTLYVKGPAWNKTVSPDVTVEVKVSPNKVSAAKTGDYVEAYSLPKGAKVMDAGGNVWKIVSHDSGGTTMVSTNLGAPESWYAHAGAKVTVDEMP